MLAVGEAAKFEAIEQIKQLGATNVIVKSVKPRDEQRDNNDILILRGFGSDTEEEPTAARTRGLGGNRDGAGDAKQEEPDLGEPGGGGRDQGSKG